jgi:ribosomal protein L16 Arg81 hydroxylase
MTYSIGMRAPEATDLALAINRGTPGENAFYSDPDLAIEEAIPGFISPQSAKRAVDLLELEQSQHDLAAEALGSFATQPKDWLRPEGATEKEIQETINHLETGGDLTIHGMAQIAFDQRKVYVNGSSRDLPGDMSGLIKDLCDRRTLKFAQSANGEFSEIIHWLLQAGAFELPGNN